MTNFLAEAMDKILSEDKIGIRAGSFERTGCLIELSNRALGAEKFTDDKVKPQGLKDKYTIPVVTTINDDEGIIDGAVNIPDQVQLPGEIDNIIDEDNGILNDLIENTEDGDQTSDDTNTSLLPEGIDLGNEEELNELERHTI